MGIGPNDIQWGRAANFGDYGGVMARRILINEVQIHLDLL